MLSSRKRTTETVAVKNKDKKKKLNSDSDDWQDSSVFGESLMKAGFILKNGSSPNILSVDQAIFQRNLTLAIKRLTNHTKVIEEFADAFKNYIDNSSRLRWSCMPTVTSSECDSARSKNQECLLRLLLNIDLLQPSIAGALLEKLPEFTSDDQSVFENNEVFNLPKLIINQFRWLDHLVNGKEFVDKLLEILSVSSLEVQRELILAIPEVIDDKDHFQVAQELRTLLTQNSDLTVSIIDALTNLNIQADVLAEIRASALQRLPCIEMEHLPVLTKFILQSVTANDVNEVVSEMRANLDFTSVFVPSSSLPQKSVTRNSEALTIDAIKSAIRFQKMTGDAWIKVIEDIRIPANHKVIDILLLLVLHSLPNRKKTIETLIRNKIRIGCFSETLVKVTFESHREIVREHFSSVLSISEVLLQSAEPAVSYFSSVLYRHSFSTFDAYCQQEVIGTLITHIGSGFPDEVDAALDIVHQIVESDIRKMAPFGIFIKNVLDYLDHLTFSQIRKVFLILSLLAFKDSNNNGNIQDDLHIIIRKQLSNSSPKYKRMGILGALMIVKCMAEKRNEVHANENAGQSSTNKTLKSTLPPEVVQQVKSLIQLVRTSSCKNPEIYALFMDELANILQKSKLDPEIEKWISESVVSDFQDDFVIDIDKNMPTEIDSLPLEISFCLEHEYTGNDIAINLFPVLINSMSENPSRDKKNKRPVFPVTLASHFRLAQIVEKNQNQGELESIDALLGCPIILCKDISENLDSYSDSELKNICSSLFICINWFREVVNAFASQKDVEIKRKAVTRLHNITTLHELLEKCLLAYPKFIPPRALFDQEESDLVVINVSNQPATGNSDGRKGSKPGNIQGTKGKSKKKGGKTTSTASSSSSKQSKIDKEEDNDKTHINLANYRHFFRELDMDVFTVLNHKRIEKQDLDSEEALTETNFIKVETAQLEFLLDDLAKKLEHSLISSAGAKKRLFLLKSRTNKKIGFSHLDSFSAKEIVVKVVNLLSALCYHLESTEEFFQEIIAKNDGIIDGPGMDSKEALQRASCYQLLLQILAQLFSWNGFSLNENHKLLKKAFQILSCRVTDSFTQASIEDLYKFTIKYLENFTNTLPNLSVAVQLLKLLHGVIEHSNLDLLKTNLETAAKNILQKEWVDASGQSEKGSKHNENLLYVLQIYLANSTEILTTLEDISTQGMQELINSGSSWMSTTYPTLQKTSFTVYYRVIMTELVNCMKIFGAGKPNDSSDLRQKRLLQWCLAIRILQIMISLIKVFDNKSNFLIALRSGRQFLELFLRLGMPLVDNLFKAHQEDVLQMFKYLQLSTRYLHYMCSHSKVTKDLAITKHVPLVKKTLETFVYRVKAMLALNNCQNAFWVGNLKNRNLQGEEISSQIANDSQSQENDEEELPEEEESDVELDETVSSDKFTRKRNDDESLSEQY